MSIVLKAFVIFMKWLSLVVAVATFVGGVLATPLFFVSTPIWAWNFYIFRETLEDIREHEQWQAEYKQLEDYLASLK